MCHEISHIYGENQFVMRSGELIGMKGFSKGPLEVSWILKPLHIDSYYNVRVEGDSVVVYDIHPGEQDLKLRLPVGGSDFRMIETKVKAGIHIGSIPLTKEYKGLRDNECLVIFLPQHVLFYDGTSVSVSQFSIKYIEPKYYADEVISQADINWSNHIYNKVLEKYRYGRLECGLGSLNIMD